MTRIAILGGTGYTGSAVAREAQLRGHEVSVYSRHAPADPLPGVRYQVGSVVEGANLEGAVGTADVVFETIAPRGDMQGKLEAVVDELIRLTDRARVRLGVMGGASSLLAAPGGPRLYDITEFPAANRPEVDTGLALLEALRNAPETLDWFYVSPPPRYGAWAPSEVTGSYRRSADIVLTDARGESSLSAGDLAIAVLDEIEHPEHRRRRFHVAH